MHISLPYGEQQTAELDIDDAKLLGACGPSLQMKSEGQSSLPLRDSIRAALDAPLGYPSFGETLMPGDQIAIAPDERIPRLDEVLAGVIDQLVEYGAAPERINILRSTTNSPERFLDLLRSEIASGLHVIPHQADESQAMCLLTNTTDGEPVVLNRAILDADVVLPIGLFHGKHLADYHGLFTAAYPRYSDVETQRAFAELAADDPHGKAPRKLAKRVEEAASLLGVIFTMQVVPDADRGVHILAGLNESVRAEANRLHHALWRLEIPRRAAVVVAGLSGEAAHQAWPELARAIECAASVVETDGAIVLCSELADEAIGLGMQVLRAATSREEAERDLAQVAGEDALAAQRLLAAQERATIYLLSGLDSELVEQLDMIPIDSADDVNRLIARHDTCAVIENGPIATGVVTSEK